MTRFLVNPHARDRVEAPYSTAPREFHRCLPGYRVTPLHPAPSLASAAGVGEVLVKDESARLGLPAFKVLGASWAVYRLACRRLGIEPVWESFDDLRDAFVPLRPLTLVTATDGNHGRAVARAARWFGFESHIFVPAGTVAARTAAIESEGAAVTVVHGSYDDAVAEAAAQADRRHVVVSDTSWPGYEAIPRDIADGYSTIFAEIDDQLRHRGDAPVDLVMVQVGVGALAAAALARYRRKSAGALVVGVEPDDAACLFESLGAGRIVTVPGPHRSIMAGLNCGTPSLVAWPLMRGGLDAAVTVDDDLAIEAVRMLAEEGVTSGGTGASGLAGLLAIARDPWAREVLGLGAASRVLVLSTEGITDPAMYERIVGSGDR